MKKLLVLFVVILVLVSFVAADSGRQAQRKRLRKPVVNWKSVNGVQSDKNRQNWFFIKSIQRRDAEEEADAEFLNSLLYSLNKSGDDDEEESDEFKTRTNWFKILARRDAMEESDAEFLNSLIYALNKSSADEAEESDAEFITGLINLLNKSG